MSRILDVRELADDAVDRLIATSYMHPVQAATAKPMLADHLADRYGVDAPKSLAVPSALDRLTWLFAEHLDRPTTAHADGLREALHVELERLVLAERHTIADQLDEQAAESNGSARFALEGFAQQLRGCR